MFYYLKIYPESVTVQNSRNSFRKVERNDLPLVAVNDRNLIIACGHECLKEFGKEEEKIFVCNPFQSFQAFMRDYPLAEAYIKWFIRKHICQKLAFFPPRIILHFLGFGRDLSKGECILAKHMLIQAGARQALIVVGKPEDAFEIAEFHKLFKKSSSTNTLDENHNPIPHSYLEQWPNKTGMQPEMNRPPCA